MTDPALRLRTTLHPRGPAAAIVLTDEQVAQVGGGAKAFPVRVTVAGHSFEGRVARMGGENLVGLNAAVRKAAGVSPGDEVDVVIVADAAPRTVEIPPALQAALDSDAAARAAFDGLAYSHRKEFARWVAEAKRDETRDRRVAETLTMLAEGRAR
ncbi:MAG: DUF1905 domain-containing protein [Frankiales bacterium]|nr:DUF1905 domain-containing protein [Frankiales bacterium]